MKQYYDVYIKPWTAGYVPTPDGIEDYDRIQIASKGTKLTVEPDEVEAGDGTSLVEAEKVMFECGVLNLSAAEYAYMRSTYHNVLIDVVLVGNGSSLTVVSGRLRCKVNLLMTSGETNIVKLNAERIIPIFSVDDEVVMPINIVPFNKAIVWGRVFDQDGITPIAYVTVSIAATSDSTQVTSDVNGYYVADVLAEEGIILISATKNGYIFPETEIDVPPQAAYTVEHNIVSTGGGT